MKSLLCLLTAAVILFACNSEHGNKVSINDKSDVFYKGDGVTEADAKRLGDYLLKEGYFDTSINKSVQLTKDSAVWVVKLVVDKEKFKTADATIATSMAILELMISSQVFNEEKTRVELVDEKMNKIDITANAGKTDTTGGEGAGTIEESDGNDPGKKDTTSGK